MGFSDFLKKFALSMATRCGVVASGEYEGCGIVFGNPPKAKVETANSFSQMIFVKDKEEKARLDIAKEVLQVEYIETIQFPKTGKDGYRCTVTTPKGETYDIDVFPSSSLRMLYASLKAYMTKETRELVEEQIKKLSQA